MKSFEDFIRNVFRKFSRDKGSEFDDNASDGKLKQGLDADGPSRDRQESKIEKLIEEIVNSRDLDIRFNAAKCLLEMGTRVSKWALEHPNPYVRVEIIKALGRIKLAAEDLISALGDILLDKKGYLSKAKSTLRDNLDTRQYEIDLVRNTQFAAAEALVKIGPKSLSRLLDALNKCDKEVQSFIVRNLGAMGLADEEMELMSNRGSEWWTSYESLGDWEGAVSELLLILSIALKNPYWRVRYSAAGVLARIGPKAKTIIPALIKGLQDQNEDVRATCAYALGRICSFEHTLAISPLLNAFLNDKGYGVSEQAAFALGNILSPASKEFVEELIPAFKSTDRDLRWRALFLLGKIGQGAGVIPALKEWLKHEEDRDTKLNIIGVLEKWGEEAIPTFIEVMNRKNENILVRRKAVRALGNLGHKANAAALFLIEALNDANWNMRKDTAEALRKIKGENFDKKCQG